MSTCCQSNTNYSPTKIHPSGLKCMPYVFTMHGIYTANGIYLKGLTPSVSYGGETQAQVVPTYFRTTCCK